MDLHIVIMAGGSGTRFWPLSRQKKPKQFLPVISEKTMIEETVGRLLPRIPINNISFIANSQQTEVIKSLLPLIPEKNLLVEPQGKNTAPSLMLATAQVFLQNPKAVVAALPADHLIQDSTLFLKKLEAAAAAASSGQHLITFGVPPTYPATGYGYIQFTLENPLRFREEPFHPVQQFKEKPDLEQAEVFLERGNYYWNSGMFLWQADVFARKLEQHASSLFPFWKRMLEAIRDNDASHIASVFEEIPSISIDYALMEKAEGTLMGKGDFGWSDVGAWSSLLDIWPQDGQGNALKGETAALDARCCLVYNPHKFTALIGVQDLIVVDTDDALLVDHKDQDQRVKDVIEMLKQKGKNEYL
ncbi:MAG: sugar phosphate nucleotidyltransferase [Candidatus Aminicenantes bacterium]|nr:sugar phosphate nucleotidyltransferase [Candidatus Aminicenantes bacterium]